LSTERLSGFVRSQKWTLNKVKHRLRYRHNIQTDQKVSVHLTITIPTQLMIWIWPSQSTFGMWTVLYWTRSSRTQFGVSVNVWRLAGGTLNISCNFLYCNHQEHREFLITLYIYSYTVTLQTFILFTALKPVPEFIASFFLALPILKV